MAEKAINRREARKVNVTFSEEAYEALETLAEERDVTMAEVLRDAISLEQWLEELRKDKDSRLLIERDGERREIILR
jgi:Ribbon-helix-helix protein, copG family